MTFEVYILYSSNSSSSQVVCCCWPLLHAYQRVSSYPPQCAAPSMCTHLLSGAFPPQVAQPMQSTSTAGSEALLRSPQRSMSSPDMSRFKFRLTSCKPPVHPESSGKMLRQQSMTEELLPAADVEMSAKSHCERHCNQERLFHQLDQKLTLHATQQPAQPTRDQHPLAAVSMPSPAVGSSQSGASAANLAVETAVGLANAGARSPAPLPLAVESSSSDELYQPTTPIRREDSLPTPQEEEHANNESLFAAIYEQTNVLLRNLHFERLGRRATSA